jgi:hypothetical protein
MPPRRQSTGGGLAEAKQRAAEDVARRAAEAAARIRGEVAQTVEPVSGHKRRAPDAAAETDDRDIGRGAAAAAVAEPKRRRVAQAAEAEEGDASEAEPEKALDVKRFVPAGLGSLVWPRLLGTRLLVIQISVGSPCNVAAALLARTARSSVVGHPPPAGCPWTQAHSSIAPVPSPLQRSRCIVVGVVGRRPLCRSGPQGRSRSRLTCCRCGW